MLEEKKLTLTHLCHSHCHCSLPLKQSNKSSNDGEDQNGFDTNGNWGDIDNDHLVNGVDKEGGNDWEEGGWGQHCRAC